MAQLSQLAIVASVHGYFNYEETTPAPRRPCNINDDSQFLDRQTSCSHLSLSLSLSLRLELHWLSLHFFLQQTYICAKVKQRTWSWQHNILLAFSSILVFSVRFVATRHILQPKLPHPTPAAWLRACFTLNQIKSINHEAL